MQGWQVSTGIGGNLPLESVAGFDRNQWQLSIGISGNLRPEYADNFHIGDNASFSRTPGR
jgi:hypothetical protein